MAKFELSIIKSLKKEGGYSDRKEDAGGETKYGITKSTARAYGYKGKMKDLPLELANKIYKERYWDALRLSDISSQRIADEVFDTAINCGIRTAGRFLQRTLNVLNRHTKDWPNIMVDGKIGDITLHVLNKASKKRELNILKVLNILQGSLYIKLAENPKRRDKMNINGWVANRINL